MAADARTLTACNEVVGLMAAYARTVIGWARAGGLGMAQSARGQRSRGRHVNLMAIAASEGAIVLAVLESSLFVTARARCGDNRRRFVHAMALGAVDGRVLHDGRRRVVGLGVTANALGLRTVWRESVTGKAIGCLGSEASRDARPRIPLRDSFHKPECRGSRTPESRWRGMLRIRRSPVPRALGAWGLCEILPIPMGRGGAAGREALAATIARPRVHPPRERRPGPQSTIPSDASLWSRPDPVAESAGEIVISSLRLEKPGPCGLPSRASDVVAPDAELLARSTVAAGTRRRIDTSLRAVVSAARREPSGRVRASRRRLRRDAHSRVTVQA